MFARTQRLLLRPAWAEDAGALTQAIADERIVRNLARVPWPYLRRHADEFVGRERAENEAVLLIFLVGAPPRLIGGLGLHPTPDGDVELGYWLTRDSWEYGYATEAASALVNIARETLRLPSLIAGHFIDNPGSGRVLRKLGFQPTGHVALRQSTARDAEVPFVEFVLELNRAGDDAEIEPCKVAA